MARLQVSVLLFSLLFGAAWCFDGCQVRYGPRGCNEGTYEGVLVTCDGNGDFADIPPMIPIETVYISLSNFQFDRLMRANFSRFRAVQCMSIMNSGVSGVDYDTFADMESLVELELHNTGMSGQDLNFINHPEFKPTRVTVSGSPGITSLDFHGTPRMEQLVGLSFKDNRISYIEPSIFSALKNLITLDLSNNHLRDMNWDKIGEMNKLNALYLDGNIIQTIPRRVFKTFFAVKELKLGRNPFHCNCNLKWLKTYYQDTSDRLIDLEEVACVSPFEEMMIDSSPDKFGCSRPGIPLITWKPLDDSEREYTYNCSSSADPAPTLTMIFPDGHTLIAPPSKDLSLLKTDMPRIISNPGPVKCIASNSEGQMEAMAFSPLAGEFWSLYFCS